MPTVINTLINTPVDVYTYTGYPPTYIFSIDVAPAHGSVQIQPSGGNTIIIYTPNLDYRGTDSFTILLQSPDGGIIFTEFRTFDIFVYGQPIIDPLLASQTVVYRQPAKTMTANGSADVLTYTWYVDDVQVQGPSSSNTLLVSASQYTVGTHTVRVVATNEAGSTDSTATLTVQGQIRPASYVDTGLSGTASGGCLVSAGGGSEVGRWSAAPTIPLIDPSGANTVASVAAAYNSLIWALRSAQMLAANQQIWFDEEPGQAGVGFTITDSANQVLHTGSYVPYPPGSPVTYLTVTDVVNGLNASSALNSEITGVRFIYDGTRISLSVPSNKTLLFNDLEGRNFASAARVMNRICYGAVQYTEGPNGDVSYTPVVGPAYKYPVDALSPLSGVAAQPNGIYNLTINGNTDTSVDLIWTKIPNEPTDPPGLVFYIEFESGGQTRYFISPDNTYTVPGLTAGTTYTVRVGTMSDYERGSDGASTTVTTYPAAPQIYTFTYYESNEGLYYTGVGWDYINPNVFIEFYDGNGIQVSASPINTTSVYDEYGSVGYVPIPAFPGTTDIKAKYYIFTGPTKTYITPFSETIQFPSPSPEPGGE